MTNFSREDYAQELIQQHQPPLDGLIVTLAHDLRNKVNGILVSVDLLKYHRDELSEAEIEQYIGYVETYAHDLAEMVNASIDCYNHYHNPDDEL